MSVNYQSLMGTSDLEVDSLSVDSLVVQKDFAVLGDTTLNTATISSLTIPGGTLDSVFRSDALGKGSWTRSVDLDSVRTGAFELVGGTVYDVLMNTGSGTQWTSDITLRTLLVNTRLTLSPGAVADQIWTCTNSLGEGEWRVPAVATLAGDVSGPSNANVVDFVGFSSAADIHSAELLANAATSSSGASTLVKRDASGNFSAGTVTANLLGNVTGNVSGSAASFTGALGGDVLGSQLATVVYSVGGSSAASVHSGEVLANAATNVNTFNSIVKRDGSGNFSAGTVTANLIGNVTGNTSGSAASFTGSLVGDVTGTQGATVVSTINGVSASLNATTNTSQVLTNKTITGISNIVDANVLRNGSTWAMPLAGAAPSLNQVLTFDGTQAIWTTPASTTSVTMGGNVTGSSSACTVVGAAGNFAVVGNATVGGTLGVTGRTTTAGLTNSLSIYYSSMNRKMFALQDLGTVTTMTQHNFDGIGMDGTNIINYQAKNTSTSHVFYAATSSTSSNTLMTINGNGSVSVPGSFTKFSVRDTSQQVRLFPTTNNLEASIAFNTNTSGPAFGTEWTMGQGSYTTAGNFGIGASGGLGSVLTIDGTTGLVTHGKTEIKSASQGIKMWPLVNNAETSVAFNSLTSGTAGSVEWTMGQGAWSVGAGAFGIGVSGTGTIGNNVLKIDHVSGDCIIAYGLKYGYINHTTVTGSFDSNFGTSPTFTIEFFQYNRTIHMIWPGVRNTTNAPNSFPLTWFSTALPTWTKPYGNLATDDIVLPVMMVNNSGGGVGELGFRLVSGALKLYYTLNQGSNNLANQCAVFQTHLTYMSAT